MARGRRELDEANIAADLTARQPIWRRRTAGPGLFTRQPSRQAPGPGVQFRPHASKRTQSTPPSSTGLSVPSCGIVSSDVVSAAKPHQPACGAA